MNEQKRKVKRKVKFEIFENGFHTQTQESGLYETDLNGEPTNDIFSDCKNTLKAKEVILSTPEGMDYLNGVFRDNQAEFVIVKVNKRSIQKFVVTRFEWRVICGEADKMKYSGHLIPL